MSAGRTREVWAEEHGGVLVEFDANKRAVEKRWLADSESWFDRVRPWLGL
jgi:hypothetical protein